MAKTGNRDGPVLGPDSRAEHPSDSGISTTVGEAVPPSGPARTDGRDTTGRFAPGNSVGQRFRPGNAAALVHGGRRLQLGHGTALDETRRLELRDSVLADLGGKTECSSVLCELVEDFAAAVVLRDTAFGHLAAVGPLTRAGRRRAAVDLYLQASQRAERLANQIGTGRTPARVPSLEEYLRARSEAESGDAPPGDHRTASATGVAENSQPGGQGGGRTESADRPEPSR